MFRFMCGGDRESVRFVVNIQEGFWGGGWRWFVHGCGVCGFVVGL